MSAHFKAATIAFAALVSTPAFARDVFECSFPLHKGNMGYLPEMVVVAHETGSDMVTVVDGYIQSEKGGPIEVKVAEENKAKLSFSWSLMLQSTGNDYVKMHYRLSIQKGSLSASLSGLPTGYSNNFSSRGTCKRVQG